jgi:hypothetical protein
LSAIGSAKVSRLSKSWVPTSGPRKLQRDGEGIAPLVRIGAQQREPGDFRAFGLDRLAAGFGQLPVRIALAGRHAHREQRDEGPPGHGCGQHEIALAHQVTPRLPRV